MTEDGVSIKAKNNLLVTWNLQPHPLTPGKGFRLLGRKKEVKRTQEDCSAMWLPVLSFMVMGLGSGLSLANHLAWHMGGDLGLGTESSEELTASHASGTVLCMRAKSFQSCLFVTP